MYSDVVNQSLTDSSPIAKNQMISGPWSILVLSNNNDGSQVAYERDFSVTATTQSTVYYTPVVTANITMTPIVRLPFDICAVLTMLGQRDFDHDCHKLHHSPCTDRQGPLDDC
jgi:hypothetical protein